jgi:hypothetical protein
MALSNAERQRLWRERHRGKPHGNPAMLATVAALEASVAQLEAELAGRPHPALRKPPGRQPADYAALKLEHDELAERLARIVAYDPSIEAKAQAWVKQVDAPPANRPAVRPASWGTRPAPAKAARRRSSPA